jgi:hypothetical protein
LHNRLDFTAILCPLPGFLREQEMDGAPIVAIAALKKA